MDAASFLENYRCLADYNRWFNARLYDASERLSDEDRKRDRGAFFGSLHATLNHILWADKIWLRRFAAQGVAFAALPSSILELPPGAMHAACLHDDWSELKSMRMRLDDAIVRWVDEMPADFPARTMRYANSAGVQREHPMWIAITHFFNHQVHHRGQATTLLMQAGVDPGVTDLIARALAKK